MSNSTYGPSGRSAWLDVDWRAHQSWVHVEGRPANVISLGSGPPVIFVHGLGGSWQNWLENLPHFAERFRVIAVDLPGFGASPMPASDISISNYGRFVVGLMDALSLSEAHLVGNSMGGFIAAEVAIQEPSRVDRMVLVSAAGLSSENIRRAPTLAAARASALGAGWVASRSDAFAKRSRLRLIARFGGIRHPHRLPGPLVAEQIRGSGKPGFLDALGALMSYPIRDRLGEISSPTLIVWGDKDPLVPLKDAHEFEKLITGSQKVVYDDTGHVPMLERPERFNRDVEEFLLAGDQPPAA